MTNRTVTGNLRVDQGSRLRESVFVSEAGILGPSAMQGEMTVLRGAAFANNITVSGVTQLLRDIRCSSFCALNDVDASQSLVAGNCTSLSSVEFGSNITMGGNLTSGTLATSGSLTAGATGANSVSCTSLQASSASTQKATARTVSLNGAASFTTDLSVNNIFAVSGDLNIGETLRAQVASATFTEDISVAGKCTINGFAQFNNLTTNQDMQVAANLIIGGHIQSFPGGLTGSPTISASTVYNAEGLVDTNALVRMSPGASDNVGQIIISWPSHNGLSVGPMTTVSVQFAEPFAIAPFVRLQLPLVWQITFVPSNPSIWLTSITATGFTLVVQTGSTAVPDPPNDFINISFLTVGRK